MRRQRWSLRRARVLVGTKFLLIAGLVGFIVVAWLAELLVGLHRPVDLGPMLAALMAGIPAVLWLGFFYLMDRHEPEPKQLVIGVCGLGALIAPPPAAFRAHPGGAPVAPAGAGVSTRAGHLLIFAGLLPASGREAR